MIVRPLDTRLAPETMHRAEPELRATAPDKGDATESVERHAQSDGDHQRHASQFDRELERAHAEKPVKESEPTQGNELAAAAAAAVQAVEQTNRHNMSRRRTGAKAGKRGFTLTRLKALGKELTMLRGKGHKAQAAKSASRTLFTPRVPQTAGLDLKQTPSEVPGQLKTGKSAKMRSTKTDKTVRPEPKDGLHNTKKRPESQVNPRSTRKARHQAKKSVKARVSAAAARAAKQATNPLTQAFEQAGKHMTRELTSMNRIQDPKNIWRPRQVRVAGVTHEGSTDTVTEAESTVQKVAIGLSTPTVGLTPTVQRVEATQPVQDVQPIHQRILDHVDTLRLEAAKSQTQLTIRMGKLGDVQVRVQMAPQANGTNQVQVVFQASAVQTASMLKDSIGQLAEALESRGYQNSTIEIKDASASETHTNQERSQQHQSEQQWEEAADDEAFAAAMGRRYRDENTKGQTTTTKGGRVNAN